MAGRGFILSIGQFGKKEFIKPFKLGWHKGCFCIMLKVKSRTGESVQQMMRRFKKLCEKEGLIRDMKRNAYYEKPSERNRRRIRKAQRILLPFTPRPRPTT
jgi:small subunit ribosomal protein S21